MPRRKVFQPVSLRVSTRTSRAHLLDISRSGALLHCVDEIMEGAQVHLVVSGTLLVGTVAWRRGSRLGLTFLAVLAEHQLDRLLAEQMTLVPGRG